MVYVFKMLLGMSGVSDAGEEDPGGFLAFNDDDDNENGVPDYDDPGDASEDDLVAITIGGSPANLSGYLELRAHTPIKVWNNQHKGAGNLLIPNGEEPNLKYYKRWLAASPPGTMWVEGCSSSGYLSGESALRLWYTPDGSSYPGAQYNRDLVNITIVQVDMDILGLDDEEEESVGAYIPLGGEKQLTLWRVQPRGLVDDPGVPPAGVPLDSGHPMTLDVKYADRGSGLIEIWDYSEWPPTKLSLPKTYTSEASLPAYLQVKGTSASSMLRGITIIWEYSIGGRTVQDRIKCTVYGVADVQWETYPDNIVEDPDHGANLALDDNPNMGGGKRIYPGKKVYEDTSDETAMRKKVRVVATIQPAVENRTVYFKWWDVDDPTTSSTIDENGADGDDNNGGCGGLGLSGGLLKTESQTDAEGKAKVSFIVSMCPGDNFKIAASCTEAKIDEMTQEQADGLTPLPDAVVMSPMLTVWRKLHIEQDSMNSVTSADGTSEQNFIFGTDAQYVYPSAYVETWTEVKLGLNLPSEFSYEGQFNPNGHFIVCGESPGIVMRNTAYVVDYDSVWVLYDISDYGSGVYKLYDDDYKLDPVDGWVPHISLPSYPVMGTYDNEYERAYITIKYLDGTYSDVVPFDRNLPKNSVASGEGTWNDSRDCSGSQAFWNALVVTGYQGTPTQDCDADSVQLLGATNDDEEAVLYLETLRDPSGGAPESVGRIIAHEVGHTGNLVSGSRAVHNGHCANSACIMEKEASGTEFCEECIKDMRSRSIWDWE